MKERIVKKISDNGEVEVHIFQNETSREINRKVTRKNFICVDKYPNCVMFDMTNSPIDVDFAYRCINLPYGSYKENEHLLNLIDIKNDYMIDYMFNDMRVTGKRIEFKNEEIVVGKRFQRCYLVSHHCNNNKSTKFIGCEFYLSEFFLYNSNSFISCEFDSCVGEIQNAKILGGSVKNGHGVSIKDSIIKNTNIQDYIILKEVYFNGLHIESLGKDKNNNIMIL